MTAELLERAPVRPEVPSDVAVETRGLTKRFRNGHTAVDGVDLAVPRGAVFGFLGPNGSGKTTTIRMLLGLVTPTAGQVALLGRPLPDRAREVLPRVGVLVEGPAFHPYLSGLANLTRLDAADATADPRTRRARTGTALERVGLTAAAGKRYRQYSLGMKQRLALAAALLQPRELLVLDEPTNGLDPQGTREVRTLVRELAADGTTVVVSSHLLAEIDQMCTHVGIMSRGHLLQQGELAELRAQGARTVTVTTSRDGVHRAVEVLAGLGLHDVRASGGAAGPDGTDGTVVAALGEQAPERVAEAVMGAGLPLRGLAVRRPSLEDVFVELTGEGFDVAR